MTPFHPGRSRGGANLVTVGSGCPLLSLDLVALCWPPTLSVNLCSQTWCTCDEDWTIYQFWLVPSRHLAHTTHWGEVHPSLIPRGNCSHSWYLTLGSCAHHKARDGCTPPPPQPASTHTHPREHSGTRGRSRFILSPHPCVSEMEPEAKKLPFLFIGPFLRNPALGQMVTHVPSPEWGWDGENKRRNWLIPQIMVQPHTISNRYSPSWR